jgi:hypothetical protein
MDVLPPPPDYFSLIESKEETEAIRMYKKFCLTSYTSKLMNLTDQGAPQEAVENVIQHFVNIALAKSKEVTFITSHVRISFANNQMHSDYLIPF